MNKEAMQKTTVITEDNRWSSTVENGTHKSEMVISAEQITVKANVIQG